ncbi:MAG: ATP-binding protein [Lachnospiraceae bacterium]|nr:ATP-binding protein [Lachnospiraceae bacterium]
MFIGREKELNSLSDLYHKDGFGMTIIYGRRRIGKSTLISEFIKNKKAIFYTATKVGKDRNLELFSKRVTTVLDPTLMNVSFPTLESIFDFISHKLNSEKLILVIDELPYWAEKDEALLSVLQKYIDTEWVDRNMMIILCGSALSFMESKVLSEKSPLFGRRDSQIKLEAFSYKEAALFVPDYSFEDKAICYGITGGVAKYLSMMNPEISLDENIKKLYFHTDGYLYDEARNLLTQEFTDVTLVNNILEQVASGVNTVNTIAQKIGENLSTILYSLDKLIRIDLVQKKKCITEEKNRKKVQYVLKDHMFKFWYAFIPNATSVIEMGQGDLYYDKIVRPNLHAFMGSVFEDMCRTFTLEQGIQGAFGNFMTNVGTWWGTETLYSVSGKYQQSADIDIVGISDIDKTVVLGECKFKNEKTDKNVYDILLRRSAAICSKYRVIKYLFFSLNGYTEWVQSVNNDAVILLTLDDLYQADLRS